MKFIVTVLFFLPICMHYCAEGHKFTRFVETKLGNVNGFRMNIGNDQKPLHHGQADVFLDIPYAKLSPAVAEMGPKKSVSVTSEGSANHREPIRAQLNHTDNQQNGNCLAMNIFSPNVQSDEKYPVLLWVHDGNSNGGSTNEWHDLVKDIVSNGVVVVLMQYRLGTLRLSQELPQNLGLPDQAEAIRFIAEHIEKFGGDRKRLMLFGESAGKFGESAGKFGESAGTASVSTNANSSSSQNQKVMMDADEEIPESYKKQSIERSLNSKQPIEQTSKAQTENSAYMCYASKYSWILISLLLLLPLLLLLWSSPISFSVLQKNLPGQRFLNKTSTDKTSRTKIADNETSSKETSPRQQAFIFTLVTFNTVK